MGRVEIRADRLTVEGDEPTLDLACLALMVHADLAGATGRHQIGAGMGFTTDLPYQDPPVDTGRYPQ